MYTNQPCLDEGIWITGDHTNFKSFFNLAAITTIIMVRALLKLRRYGYRYEDFAENFHISRRFREKKKTLLTKCRILIFNRSIVIEF